MDTLQLTPQAVDAYQTLLTKPRENGLDFEPITDCFIKSDSVTAFHVLFQKYIEYLQKPLPKVMFYIVFERIFGPATGKDENGHAGYHLALNPNLSVN